MSELKPVIDFLRELSANNGKPWFDAHKETYREVQTIFAGFTERFIAGVEEFDKSVSGLTVKECTWRIYRDIRFSADKTPYKTHFGAWVAPQGKKSGYAGYYIHIQPDEELYMICAGLHCPTPAMIRSVREEIMTDGDGFHAAVVEAGGFSLDRSIATKRVPAGYPADDPQRGRHTFAFIPRPCAGAVQDNREVRRPAQPLRGLLPRDGMGGSPVTKPYRHR